MGKSIADGDGLRVEVVWRNCQIIENVIWFSFVRFRRAAGKVKFSKNHAWSLALEKD